MRVVIDVVIGLLSGLFMMGTMLLTLVAARAVAESIDDALHWRFVRRRITSVLDVLVSVVWLLLAASAVVIWAYVLGLSVHTIFKTGVK